MEIYLIIGVVATLLIVGLIIYSKIKKLSLKQAISLFADISEKLIGKGKGQEKFNLLLQLLLLYLKSQIKSRWILAIINIIFSTKKVENIVNKDLNIKQKNGTYENSFDLSEFKFKRNYIEAYAESDIKDFFNKNNEKIGVAIGRKF